jgi:hypothetical protein
LRIDSQLQSRFHTCIKDVEIIIAVDANRVVDDNILVGAAKESDPVVSNGDT